MATYSYSYKGVDKLGADKVIKASFDTKKDSIMLSIGYQEIIIPLEVIDHLNCLAQFVDDMIEKDMTNVHTTES